MRLNGQVACGHPRCDIQKRTASPGYRDAVIWPKDYGGVRDQYWHFWQTYIAVTRATGGARGLLVCGFHHDALMTEWMQTMQDEIDSYNILFAYLDRMER